MLTIISPERDLPKIKLSLKDTAPPIKTPSCRFQVGIAYFMIFTQVKTFIYIFVLTDLYHINMKC